MSETEPPQLGVHRIVRKRVPLPKAFRDEIKCWRLSFGEESMLRVFVACVATRMKGENPDDLAQGKNGVAVENQGDKADNGFPVGNG